MHGQVWCPKDYVPPQSGGGASMLRGDSTKPEVADLRLKLVAGGVPHRLIAARHHGLVSGPAMPSAPGRLLSRHSCHNVAQLHWARQARKRHHLCPAHRASPPALQLPGVKSRNSCTILKIANCEKNSPCEAGQSVKAPGAHRYQSTDLPAGCTRDPGAAVQLRISFQCFLHVLDRAVLRR